MKKNNLGDIAELLGEHVVIGNEANISFTNVKPVNEANEESLAFIDKERTDVEQLISGSKANTIVCSQVTQEDIAKIFDKNLIVVKDPRKTICKIINKLFVQNRAKGVHPTAIIHEQAEIHETAYIGPYTFIGNSKIGEGTEIHGNCYVYDNAIIGKNVKIYAGCIIGTDGFGFFRDDNIDVIHEFPHLGRVIIEDEVVIQGLTNVDKGALGDTIIGKGTKIDTQCHIGHNTKTGSNCIITTRAMIGGGTTVGNNCWIAPSVTFRDGIHVGNNVFVGMGSLVVKNVGDNQRIMGSPAIPVEEFKELHIKLKKLG